MTALSGLVKTVLRRTGWALCRARTLDQLEELKRDPASARRGNGGRHDAAP